MQARLDITSFSGMGPQANRQTHLGPPPARVANSEHTYYMLLHFSFAIDHRVRNIRVPVRSPIVKPCVGPLVVGSVTTSESELSIVLGKFLLGRVLLCGRVLQRDGWGRHVLGAN